MMDGPCLSVAEIAQAMDESRDLARELVGDAGSLERSHRLPRAFALYFCAAEELAKFYTLELAGRQLVHGSVPDWPGVWRKLRSHDVKIVEAHTRMRDERDGAPETGYGALRLSGLGAMLINGSATTSGADWRISLSATRALALRMLADSALFGDDADDIRATLSEDSRKDLAIVVNSVVYALEQARRQGFSKENVIRYLDRIAFADAAAKRPTADVG
jgi:hypothetical protein